MFRLAVRSLFQNKIRLVVSTGGVALALMLVLTLDAIFGGVEKQLTAYIRSSKADVFVSQSGVRNMHMVSSWMPASVVEKVEAVPGVQSASPILYVTNMVAIGKQRSLAYIIGLPAEASLGVPWRIGEGKAVPDVGEAVVDRTVAKKSNAGIGDEVSIMGRTFTIAGLSENTASIANSVVFISARDFAHIRGNSGMVSFVLVQVTPGESPDAVAGRITSAVAGVLAQSTAVFAEQERRIVRDMSTDVIAIMNLAGFLIGMAVMALTVYTAVLARRQEYGILKAVGARNAQLFTAVISQALMSVALGFAAGLAFTAGLAAVVPRVAVGMVLSIGGPSLLKASGISVVIAGLSAIMPIIRIAGLDPAIVFQGGGRK